MIRWRLIQGFFRVFFRFLAAHIRCQSRPRFENVGSWGSFLIFDWNTRVSRLKKWLRQVFPNEVNWNYQISVDVGQWLSDLFQNTFTDLPTKSSRKFVKLVTECKTSILSDCVLNDIWWKHWSVLDRLSQTLRGQRVVHDTVAVLNGTTNEIVRNILKICCQ